MPDHPLRPATPRLLWRGITGRCPVCGGRGVFAGWFTLRSRCPRCDFAFERAEGHWLGAIGMNTIVSTVLLFATIVVGFVVTWPDPPAITLAAIAAGVAIVVPLVFYPLSQTLWSAIDLAMRPLEIDEALGVEAAADDG